jgi:hypothetical protein
MRLTIVQEEEEEKEGVKVEESDKYLLRSNKRV